MNTPSDYVYAAQAISFIRKNFRSQPSLQEVAAHVGLSPFHFQRLFTRWAGVSPKRFLQSLTADYAKERLRASESVLRAAFSAGLSGPARLHDLLVSTTAVTPGEYRSGGEGLTILQGIADTPFGPALFGNTPRGLCHLAFLDSDDPLGSDALARLRAEWPAAELVHSTRSAQALARSIFRSPERSRAVRSAEPERPLHLLLRGTNFQIRVWEALLKVPEGALTTYGYLAEALEKKGAARAVGTAVGSNSIAYVIPCHRVIRGEGTLGGYRWGDTRKAALLGWEAQHGPVSSPTLVSPRY